MRRRCPDSLTVTNNKFNHQMFMEPLPEVLRTKDALKMHNKLKQIGGRIDECVNEW